MPVRAFSRAGQWLLPPRVDELIGQDHAVRFVAAFVDGLEEDTWRELEVVPGGERDGAAAYHPALLLSVWLYGFMTKVRSSRRLEAACYEQLPFIWLAGNQKPDHNTLWRFYKEHRQAMRLLLRRTVRTAVAAGLPDLALQAVDGTRLAGNASPDRTYNEAGLARLLQKVEAAIADLESQNATGGNKPASHLPKELENQQALRAQVQAAMAQVAADEHRTFTNLTDPDAALLRTRGGYVTGYNAQAMASPLKQAAGGSRGQFITAVAVVNEVDVGQLLPMIEASAANTEVEAGAVTTLADAGYHSGVNLAACAAQAHVVVMPEPGAKARMEPYHKSAFVYDPRTDTYTCPRGEKLGYKGVKREGNRTRRWYVAQSAAACRACPAFGVCTTNQQMGRSLHVGEAEEALQRHRVWMQSEAAQTAYKKRKELIEPVFGIIKEQLMGTRRFLLRGIENVRAEWTLLAVAFNLRVLARLWTRTTAA